MILAALGGLSLHAGNPLGLNIAPSNSAAVLIWSDTSAILQCAPVPTGVWSNVSSATSPFPVFTTGPAEFFRLHLTCDPPPSGIVSWWTGDDTAADRVGTNNGTSIGGVTYTNGEVAECFNFDGVSGYVDIPNSVNLNPTGPFSVEFWMKGSAQQSASLFEVVDKSHGFTDSTGWTFEGQTSGGKIGFYYGLGGGGNLNFAGSITTNNALDNQWHHLAGVWTGTQTEIYMDGVLQETNSSTTLPANNQRDLLFGTSWGGGANTRFFRGQLDEVTYYDRALTSEEVILIFDAGICGKCKD